MGQVMASESATSTATAGWISSILTDGGSSLQPGSNQTSWKYHPVAFAQYNRGMMGGAIMASMT